MSNIDDSNGNRDLLIRLQKWYRSHCDGDWEHQYGVDIDTLDNPAWAVKIDLEGTGLENRPFREVKDMESERDWIYCRVEEKLFHGVGGPEQLHAILQTFLDWAELD